MPRLGAAEKMCAWSQGGEILGSALMAPWCPSMGGCSASLDGAHTKQELCQLAVWGDGGALALCSTHTQVYTEIFDSNY